jgi:hypothetical protein
MESIGIDPALDVPMKDGVSQRRSRGKNRSGWKSTGKEPARAPRHVAVRPDLPRLMLDGWHLVRDMLLPSTATPLARAIASSVVRLEPRNRDVQLRYVVASGPRVCLARWWRSITTWGSSKHGPWSSWPRGAGTSTNMNANEVLANVALELSGHKKASISSSSRTMT